MPDMLVGDVTYTHLSSKSIPYGRLRRMVRITFPTNAGRLDYPAGGIPLTNMQLGFPNGVATLEVVGRTVVVANANPDWMWDGSQTAPKLLGFEQADVKKQASELSTALNDKALTENGQVLTLAVEGF